MDERERWQWGFIVLVAVGVVLFLLVVVLNGGAILVGTVLTIFKIAISVLILVLLGIGLVYLAEVVRNAETRILRQLDALGRVVWHATTEFGAEVLSVLSGALVYVIQEMLKVNGATELHQVVLTLLFTFFFFGSAQLIGTTGRRRRTLGIVFYWAPVVALVSVITINSSWHAIITWLSQQRTRDLLLISFAGVSVPVAFILALLKTRRGRSEEPAARS
jgi:hypothetical protein